MSALAYLSGIASGVGDEYSKQAEDKRRFKQQKDMQLASDTLKTIQDDNTADWPTTQSRLSLYYKTMGVPDKDAGALINHHKGIFDRYQTQQSKSPQFKGAPGGQPALGALPGNGQIGEGEGGAPALPGSDLQTPSLPPLPQSQQPPATAGDIRATQQASETNIATEAQINKMRQQLQLFQDSGATSGGHYKVSLTPNGPSMLPDQGVSLPGVSEGTKWGQVPNSTVFGGGQIQPGAFYRGRRYEDGKVELFPAQEVTNAKVVFDANSPTQASYAYYDPNGIEIHRNPGAPSAFLPKTTNGVTTEFKLNPSTGQFEKFIAPSSHTVTPVVGGAPQTPAQGGAQVPQAGATPLSPIPQAPRPKVTGGVNSKGVAQLASAAGSGKLGIPGGPAGVQDITGQKNNITPIYDPTVTYLTGQVASGRMKVSDIHGDGVRLTDKQMRGYVQHNLAALGLDINKITTYQYDTARFSQSLQEKYPHIMAEVDQLDKEGKLGVVASRFNEFMSGKVGDGPEFAKLRLDIGLVQTALMKIHTGSRGSTTIMTKLGDLINGNITNAATLRSELQEAKFWIDSYAQLAETGPEALGGAKNTPNTPVPNNTQSIKDDLVKQFTGAH